MLRAYSRSRRSHPATRTDINLGSVSEVHISRARCYVIFKLSARGRVSLLCTRGRDVRRAKLVHRPPPTVSPQPPELIAASCENNYCSSLALLACTSVIINVYTSHRSFKRSSQSAARFLPWREFNNNDPPLPRESRVSERERERSHRFTFSFSPVFFFGKL